MVSFFRIDDAPRVPISAAPRERVLAPLPAVAKVRQDVTDPNFVRF